MERKLIAMIKVIRSALKALVGLLLAGYIGLLVSNTMSNTPSYIGVKNGRLTPAYAAKPNNVTSYEAGAYPKEQPLSYSGDQAIAKQRLIDVVTNMPRTRLETDDGAYLHFTSRSFLFRFVDDLEFLFDDANKQIHLRVGARSGYSDLGVNQKRVAEIREKFER